MGKVNPEVLNRILAAEGNRLEISEPFLIDSSGRYMCLGKIVGRRNQVPRIQDLFDEDEEDEDPTDADAKPTDAEAVEPTQTLCVFSEEGSTPEKARERLLQRIEQSRHLGNAPRPVRPRRGWLGRLIAVFTGSTKPA